MQAENHIQSSICGPTDQAIKIAKTTSGIVFPSLHKVFSHPKADGDANDIEAKMGDLLDVSLCDPSIPMFSKNHVCSLLAKPLHT